MQQHVADLLSEGFRALSEVLTPQTHDLDKWQLLKIHCPAHGLVLKREAKPISAGTATERAS